MHWICGLTSSGSRLEAVGNIQRAAIFNQQRRLSQYRIKPARPPFIFRWLMLKYTLVLRKNLWSICDPLNSSRRLKLLCTRFCILLITTRFLFCAQAPVFLRRGARSICYLLTNPALAYVKYFYFSWHIRPPDTITRTTHHLKRTLLVKRPLWYFVT